MCIHERQLLLKSFLFNYYFYFFADLSRFHCDIGGSLFLSSDFCCSYRCFLHSNGNDLFLAAGQCNGHFDYYLNSSPQPFHWQRANFGLTIIEHPLTDLQCCISLRYHTSCKELATQAEEIPELSAGQAEWWIDTQRTRTYSVSYTHLTLPTKA